jgi:hypothetical protein
MVLSSQRRLGLVLGLILGLGFSATSNLINSWVMPQIPLATPWPGTFWLTALSIAMFGLLGLLAAWTEENLPGIFFSALVGTLISTVWSLVSDSSNRVGTFVILTLIFLPRIFFYLPFGWLVRWLVDKLRHPYPSRGGEVAPVRRLIPVFASFLVVVLIGMTARVSAAEQKSLTRMKELIEEGRLVSTRAELPSALRNVNGFVENANGAYAFSLGANPDALPVQRPLVKYGEEEPFVIVRFENGFRFGCVFSPPYVVPVCIDF